jgi:hypothetical protein
MVSQPALFANVDLHEARQMVKWIAKLVHGIRLICFETNPAEG